MPKMNPVHSTVQQLEREGTRGQADTQTDGPENITPTAKAGGNYR